MRVEFFFTGIFEQILKEIIEWAIKKYLAKYCGIDGAQIP